MNALNMKSALALALVLSFTGGLWIQQTRLQNRSPANWEPATAAATTEHATMTNPAAYPGAPGPAYAATVTARSSNAFEARLMLEQQINTISRTARSQGGGIWFGETHYRRVENNDGSLKSNRNYDFIIVQRINIVFPAGINQVRAESMLARLAVNGVRIHFAD